MGSEMCIRDSYAAVSRPGRALQLQRAPFHFQLVTLAYQVLHSPELHPVFMARVGEEKAACQRRKCKAEQQQRGKTPGCHCSSAVSSRSLRIRASGTRLATEHGRRADAKVSA